MTATEIGANSRSASVNVDRGLVVPAGLELALLDPQVAREVGIVVAHLCQSMP